MRAAWLVIFLVVTVGFVAAGKTQTTTATATTPATSATTKRYPVDSIQFVSVKTKHDVPIQRGKPIEMTVKVHYTLASHESAVISVSAAQFRDPQHCVGNGELVTARTIVVYRGSGTVSLFIIWPGDTGEYTMGRVYGSGSLSFSGAFWESAARDGVIVGDPKPNLRIGAFGRFDFSNVYCAAF